MKTFAMIPLALAVIGVLGAARPAVSQIDLPQLEAGQMLRITSALLPDLTVARFQEFRADTLVATTRTGGLLAVPLWRIDHLEAGRQDYLLGAQAGSVAGALLATGLLSVASGASSFGLLDCYRCGLMENLKVSAMIGVPLGGVLGALLGGSIGATRWEPVSRWSGDAGREP